MKTPVGHSGAILRVVPAGIGVELQSVVHGVVGNGALTNGTSYALAFSIQASVVHTDPNAPGPAKMIGIKIRSNNAGSGGAIALTRKSAVCDSARRPASVLTTTSMVRGSSDGSAIPGTTASMSSADTIETDDAAAPLNVTDTFGGIHGETFGRQVPIPDTWMRTFVLCGLKTTDGVTRSAGAASRTMSLPLATNGTVSSTCASTAYTPAGRTPRSTGTRYVRTRNGAIGHGKNETLKCTTMRWSGRTVAVPDSGGQPSCHDP